jgi:hypothetical protein
VKEMENLKDLQKQEAVKRLKLLKVSKNVLREFEQEDVVYYSERQNNMFDGILYWISNEPQYEEAVSNFEKEHNALVYHAQLTHTEFGDLLSLMYISKNKSEWEQDIDDIKTGQAVVYVLNVEDNLNSEFGSIGITPRNGGVGRTW